MTTLGEGRSVCRTQDAFPAVACPPDAKTGAAGNTVDQNRLKLYRARPFGLQAELESESKKEIRFRRSDGSRWPVHRSARNSLD
jgi:hypothetical protein